MLMSYAFNLFSTGGSQFKKAVNDTIMVNKLPAKVGSKIKLEKVRKLSGL